MLSATKIVAFLLEELGPEDIEQMADVVRREPENYMEPKSAQSPVTHSWLEKRYDLDDSTLGGFVVKLHVDQRPDAGEYTLAYGFDTDMHYKYIRIYSPTPHHREVFFIELKYILSTMIPPMIDKLDHDKMTVRLFIRKVDNLFHEMNDEVRTA